VAYSRCHPDIRPDILGRTIILKGILLERESNVHLLNILLCLDCYPYTNTIGRVVFPDIPLSSILRLWDSKLGEAVAVSASLARVPFI
jgi:hypothetical protein